MQLYIYKWSYKKKTCTPHLKHGLAPPWANIGKCVKRPICQWLSHDARFRVREVSGPLALLKICCLHIPVL